MKGVIRPKMAVLPDSAQVPRRNLVQPPPTRFTHEVTRAQDFYYQSRPPSSAQAAGTFAPGTRVVRLTTHTPLCRVVDGRGLSVFTAASGLAPLPSTPSRTIASPTPSPRSRRTTGVRTRKR